MAVVRELITVLGTSVDQTGFKQYETGIARVKALAMDLGKMFGIAFGAEKIIEFADELVKSGKEINRLNAQLKILARPFDDINAAQEGVFNIAQRLGIEYQGVLETFREFYNEMRETNIPQEQILTTTENIYKALQVGKASAEDMHATMELFQRSFRRGGMRSVGVGQLTDIAPIIADKLKAFFNVNEEGLRQMAKDGKLTAEALVAALGTADAKLDADWSKVPMKLGRVFTIIKNDLIGVVAQIYKLTEMSSFFGRIILYVWVQFRNAVVSTTQALGGLENVLRLVGIAAAIAFGPMIIRNLISIVAWTGVWLAQNLLLVAGWLAIGAAVLAAALAIEDIIGWMQGKQSYIGTWVGPFKDLQENFKNLDIFSGFRLFSDAWKGDWESFKKDWGIFVTNGPAEILAISTAVGGIGVAFLTVIPAIKQVIEIVKLLRGETAATAAAIEATKTAAAGGAAGQAATAAQAMSLLRFLGFAGLGTWAGLSIGKEGSIGGNILPGPRENQIVKDALGRPVGTTDVAPKIGNWGPEIGPAIGSILKQLPSSIPGITTGWDLMQLFRNDKAWNFLDRLTYGPESIRQPPGALGPRIAGAGPTEIAPVLNQTNNIRVETTLDSEQIGRVVEDKMKANGTQAIDALTRSLQTSAPAVEQRTQ